MPSNRKYLMATVGAAALVVSLALTPQASAEPLESAVVAALNNHPSVAAAMANRDALNKERDEHFSGYFPELNLGLSGGRMYGDNSTSRGLSVTRGAGYSWYGEGSASVRQMIFDGFETWNRVDAATARKDSANFNILDVREHLALRTAMVYMDILRSRETVAKITAHNAKLADYRKRIESMVKEGAADEAVLVQAKDIQAQLDSTLAGVKGQMNAAMAEYQALTGMTADEGMKRPPSLADKIPADVEQAIKTAFDAHPALQAAAASAAAYSHDIDAERGALFPDVTGELSYTKRDQRDLIGGESVDARALLRANWAFQTGGEQIARMKKTQFRQVESEAQRQEREREIEQKIRSSYADLDTTKQQLDILTNRFGINKDLFRTQQTQFEGARVTLLQLMQTDNALFNADLSLLNGEFRHLAAQYAVMAGMGRLQDALRIAPVAAKAVDDAKAQAATNANE